jgi:molybdenum cofactor cytidylyltransferase
MGCILKGNSGLYSRMTVGAVLLAAGAGSRLGGRPKALLELGGVPLILRQLVALSGAGVDEVVVVLGHHAEAIEAAVQAFPIGLVHNPRPDDGRASSVRVGLQALSPKLDAVIVALADQPLIDAQDIVALIGAYKKRGDAAMVVPRVGTGDGTNEPGNPLIFDGALRDAWLAGEADLACRRWRDANPQRVHWFDTDNRRYRLDIDTPEDLERFAADTGHVLRWPAALAPALQR